MKLEKKNNRYYANDLDLEEVLSNRKYVMSYVDKQIDFLKSTKMFNNNPVTKAKLDLLYDIKNRFRLRK